MFLKWFQLFLIPFNDVQLDGAVIGATFQQKWSELQKLLERQRAKGGIIDPEAESNRFLIHINEVRGHHLLHTAYPSSESSAPIG